MSDKSEEKRERVLNFHFNCIESKYKSISDVHNAHEFNKKYISGLYESGTIDAPEEDRLLYLNNRLREEYN